jgi:hypothetical protein
MYNPNTINGNNQQVLGDAVVMYPKAGLIGSGLMTVRVFGAGATGVYNKLHKRMHTDYFNVIIAAS